MTVANVARGIGLYPCTLPRIPTLRGSSSSSYGISMPLSVHVKSLPLPGGDRSKIRVKAVALFRVLVGLSGTCEIVVVKKRRTAPTRIYRRRPPLPIKNSLTGWMVAASPVMEMARNRLFGSEARLLSNVEVAASRYIGRVSVRYLQSRRFHSLHIIFASARFVFTLLPIRVASCWSSSSSLVRRPTKNLIDHPASRFVVLPPLSSFHPPRCGLSPHGRRQPNVCSPAASGVLKARCRM